MSKVIQQFIYADLTVDITLQIEEERRDVVDAFKKNSTKIEKDTVELMSSIQNVPIPKDGKLSKEIRDSILSTLDGIPSIIQQAQDRPIKVALLGPRRNGKSEVANCILGRNYVPTTMELITPTNCIYERSPDGVLRVIQETVSKIENENSIVITPDTTVNNEKIFDTPEDLRNYLQELFSGDNIQFDKDKGYSIPEVRVQYNPPIEAPIKNVILIDTPGPNISGTNKHKKMAYRWLKEADVVLFVIELQYARNKENVEFIEAVQQEVFHDKGKNYSLIFVGNKSDLRFGAGEKPSLIRMLDRFKNELYELGLDAFVSVSTSALNYNSITKMVEEYKRINGEEKIDNESADQFRDIIEHLEEKYGGGDNNYILSALSQLAGQSRALRIFYKQYTSINSMKHLSGIDTLVDFTKYIADEKALFEVIDFALRNIRDNFISINNNLIAKGIANFSGNKDKVNKILNKYKDFVRNQKEVELPKLQLDNNSDYSERLVKSKLTGQKDAITNRLIERFVSHIRTINVENSSKEKIINDIIDGYSRLVDIHVKRGLEKTTENFAKSDLKEIKKNVEEKLAVIYEKLRFEFEKIKIELKKENLNMDKFVFPRAPSFPEPSMNINFDLYDSLRVHLNYNIVDRTDGPFFKVLKWIDRNTGWDISSFFKDILKGLFGDEIANKILRTGDSWTVYSDDIKKSELGKILSSQAIKIKKDFEKALINETNEWLWEYNKNLSKSIDALTQQLNYLSDVLNREHENLENQIEYLNQIEQQFIDFQNIPEVEFVLNLKKEIMYAA